VLSSTEKEALLGRARHAIAHALGASEPEAPPEAQGRLLEPMGAFVTLHTQAGALRGCIGTLVSERPLADVVDEMAVSAATRDPRFASVTPEELPSLLVEISVLGPLQSVSALDDIEVGSHGLLASGFGRRGVLLPQVATEHHLDAGAFVEATCQKAGLPSDAWQAGLARLEKFRAEVFSETAGPREP
jgi:AmmeMemoRadiSam system protein A